MYYVSTFDSEDKKISSRCFFDRKTDAVNFYNRAVDYHDYRQKTYNDSIVHRIEISFDDRVLDEVTLCV